jgi:hypothetical protein
MYVKKLQWFYLLVKIQENLYLWGKHSVRLRFEENIFEPSSVHEA